MSNNPLDSNSSMLMYGQQLETLRRQRRSYLGPMRFRESTRFPAFGMEISPWPKSGIGIALTQRRTLTWVPFVSLSA